MHTLRSLAVALALVTGAAQASAQLATFDDLAGCTPDNYYGVLVDNGYSGFNWSNFYVTDGLAAATTHGGPGYNNGAITRPCVALNGFGAASEITSSTAFTFNGGYFTAAYQDGLSVMISGFSGTTQVFSQMLSLNTGGPLLWNVNWTGVDRVRFESGDGQPGSQFVFDNFRFNNTPDPSIPTVTPEPASLLLLGTGLAGVVARRGRRRKNTMTDP